MLNPPVTAPGQLIEALRDHGQAVLSPAGLFELIQAPAEALNALRGEWNSLPPDAYLRDGGRYRRRRHADRSTSICVCRSAPVRARPPRRPVTSPNI